MVSRIKLGELGLLIYGLAAIALGLVGFVWDDFAEVWQPVPKSTPYRWALAYIVSAIFILAGIAILTRRFTKPALIVLSFFYLVYAALWVPRVFLLPKVYGTWGGVLEQFSPVAAALLMYGTLEPANTRRNRALRVAGRISFAICVVSFALNHFFAIPVTARLVPSWIPPNQKFWAVATGIAFLLAGLSILSGFLDVLASRLVTLMIVLFGALVWLPALVAAPHKHWVWSANAINLSIAAATWVASDAFSRMKTEMPDGAPYSPHETLRKQAI